MKITEEQIIKAAQNYADRHPKMSWVENNNGFIFGCRWLIDQLYPNGQSETDNKDINARAEAFYEIVKVMEQVSDSTDRIKLYLALQNYIQAS